MDNVNEFIKTMGICDEGSIIADDDYETSNELGPVSDLLSLIDGGSKDGEI